MPSGQKSHILNCTRVFFFCFCFFKDGCGELLGVFGVALTFVVLTTVCVLCVCVGA